jgi:7,8-dihydropterin-6-yl-methyl-4-(beta-D-ribofuranosyl)aminobenzene 5'-phosphate synthase
MEPITRRKAIKKAGRFLLGAFAYSLSPLSGTGCSQREVDTALASRLMRDTQKAKIDDIRFTILYDNVPYKKGLRTDWGFSCLVEGLDKTILFDSGRYDEIFLSNLSKLNVDLKRIDELFLSHDHPDHIGGVMKVLNARPDINISLVESFPWGFKKAVSKKGGHVSETDHPCNISRNCLSTGEMTSAVKNEHALIIPTDQGSIILTGCAHPGVVEIVEQTKAITKQDVLLVAGGFHLLMDDASSIRKKAERLKQLGVRNIAPSHCSGGEAIGILAEIFGDRFLRSGAGRIISVSDFTLSA